MAKLSHIEDIELKRAQEAMQQANAQQAQQTSQTQATQETKEAPDQAESGTQTDGSMEMSDTQGTMTAQQEADYHGIDAEGPMSIGHRFLIILAVLVTFAAILYIVNSWVHFI